MQINLILLLGLFLLPVCGFTQQVAEVDTLANEEVSNSFFAVPLVFSSPETSWGFGAAGIYAFRFKGQSAAQRTSQIQLGGAYTLNDQILLYLPFQLFLEEERVRLYGELGYYRYSYFFYGIGNDFEDYDGELFSVNYPRVRINAVRRMLPNTFVGLRYWMDDYQIKKTEGLLQSGDILGSRGGFLSGLGLVLNYDSRDNINYPHKGWFLELVAFKNGTFLGSDFDFSKYIVDLARYEALSKTQILALHTYVELTSGAAPFNQLALLGGTRRMRGYYEGRFRDNHLWILEGEYRFPLFWLLKGAVFAGAGSVAEQVQDFTLDHLRYTAGLGLRVLLLKEEQIHIRLDYGFGKNTSGFYLTIGEAF